MVAFVENNGRDRQALDYSMLSKEILARCNVIRKKSVNVLKTRQDLYRLYDIGHL
jgi:hypothetical protein